MRRKIRLGILLLMAVALSSATAEGQILENYRFETGTTNTWYSADTELIAAGKDDAVSAVTDIGFTFYYDGVAYTQFSVNSNGILRLGSTLVGTNYNNHFGSNLSVNNPKIVGVGRDMSTGAAGYVKTGSVGTQNNLIRVVEYLLNTSSSSSGTNYFQFQIQLYQGSNEIRIVYGTNSDYQSVPSSYQIGLVNADGNKIWVVSPNLHVADYATSAVSDSYSVHPGSGRFYSFAPDPLKTIGAAANLPYACNFENTTENANWAFGNAVDGWAIGSATNNAGSNSLYVSNDGGTTNAYNSGAQYIYAIRALNIQATGSYKVSYNWKCQGENNCDYLRAFLVPASLSPDLVGRSQQYINSITTSSCPGGWIAIDGGANLGRQTEWQTKALTVSLSSTGTYYLVFYWRSDGSVQGGNNNPPAAVDNVSVKYLPVAASLPYTCNFETASENTKWILANGSQANYWMIGNSTYSSSSKSLYITNDGSSNAYTIKLTTTPNAASSVYAYRNLTFASAGNYVVSFKWKGVGESTYDYLRAFLVPNSVETLEAGNMNSIGTAGSPTNWIAVDGDTKLNLQSSWQVNSQTVNVPTAGEYNLVFYWRNDNSSGTQPPIAIDDIEVAQPCTATAGIAVNVQGPTSAVITRTSGDADAYQLLVSSNSNPYAATETPVAMTSSSMTLSDLAEHTTYYAFIRCRCSEYRYGEWSNAVNFTTPYTPATVPYTCDFEDATVNSKWILANMVGGNYWMIGNAPSDGSSNSLYITNDSSSYTYTVSSALSYVYAYRNLNFATAGDYVVSFKWKGYGEGNYDYLRAFLVPISVQTLTGGNANGIVATGAPSGWIAVDGGSKLNLKSDWQVNSQTVNIQTPGEYNLLFFWRNDGTSGTLPPAAVDDIEVSTPCTASATITVGEVEFTSAVITRTSGSSSKYEVLISTSSDPAAATETPFELTSASQTINELTPGTQYYAYIRGYCSEYRPGPWSSAVSFETESAFTLPYHQDFESGEAYGWTMANATNGWYVGTATAKDGEYSLYVSNNGGGVNEYSPYSYSYSYAYCKLLVEETGVFNVSFDWKCYGYNNFHLLRAFLIPARLNPNLNSGQPNGMANNSNNAPAEWIAIDGGKLNFSRDWTHLSNDLILSETGEYYLVFYWRNDLYSVLYNPPAAVDNISVEFSTACLPVTNLVTTNVGKTSASVTWTPVGDETQWQVSLTSSQSTSPDDGNITLVNTTSHTFTGLNYDTYYYAYARAYCSESDQSPWTPVRTFLTKEACAKISDLTKSDITPTSVTLSWTSTDADASQWEVVVNQSSDPTVDVVATMVVENTTATITGLTPGYNYNVHVRCNCGEHGYSDWYNGSFGTLDEDIPLPYSEDFESGLPSQWIITESGNNKWYVGRGANNGGVRSLYISNNNGASNNYDIQSSGMSCAYFIFEVEERCVLNVSYDWKCDGEDSYDFARAFVVHSSLEPAFYLYNGVSAYSAPSGWIPVDEGQMSGSSSWNHTSENVALEPGYYYLAFYWQNDGSVGTQPPAAIDNLSVSVATNCMYSGNVDISNIGKTTAQASWSSSSEVSQFEVLVTTASNPDEATETPILLSSTNYEISGLDTETEYYVYVRGVCSETSKGVWYQSDFTTSPSCLPLSGVNFGVITKTTIEMFLLNEDPDASQWEVLVTTASSIDEATESSHIVDNLNPTIEGLTPGTQYSVYARTYCSSTDQSEWLSVGTFTTYPACIDVIDVTVDSYDRTWATVSWTNVDVDATLWQVLVTTASNPMSATEAYEEVDNTTLTVPGLSPNTQYHIYVRANCNEYGYSDWVGVDLRTLPELVALPYYEDFEDDDVISSSWVFENDRNGWYVGTATNNGGTHSLYVSQDGGLSNTYDYQWSYEHSNTTASYAYFTFNVEEQSHVTISYDRKGYGDGAYGYGRVFIVPESINPTFAIGVTNGITSSYCPSEWMDCSAIYYQTVWNHTPVINKLLNPGTYYVVFYWYTSCYGGNNPPAAIDNLRINTTTCIYNGNITSSNVGKTTATLSWPDDDNFSQWEVLLTTSNYSDLATETPVLVSGNTYELTNLEPETEYNAFVRGYCSESSVGAWSRGWSFTTLPACRPVTNVYINSSAVGKTSAIVSWTNVDEDASQWQVLVTTVNSPEEATETPILVDATTATISNLEMNTEYNAYVRSYCSESSQSAWSSGRYFRTMPPCEPVYDLNAVVTPTSATIRWLHPYDKANYYTILSETAMTPEQLAAASYQTTRNKFRNLNDLTPGTTYHEYVAVDCYDGDMSEWVHLEFTTPEQEAMPLPYYENFEDGVVQNWTVSNHVNGWYLGSAVANESSMSMYVSPDEGATYQFNTNYSVSYAYCRLNIDHPSIINVSYDWTGEGYGVAANMRTFLIPVDLNPNLTAGTLNGVTSVANAVNAPSGWIELGSPYPVQCAFFNSAAASGWLRSTKDVMLSDAGDYYLVYFWGNNANFGPLPSAAVDNISVTYVSDCVFSEDLSVDNITRTSADISWTTTGSADQWQVIVSRSNNLANATANETPVLVSNNTYTATGLDENTTYYIYIRSYCSESDQSLWVAGPSFTTLPPCQPPTIRPFYLTATSVIFEWTQPYEYNNFNVYISQSEMTDEQLNEAAYTNVSDLYYEETGLTPGQTYHAYVSSACQNNETSEWAVYDFQTPESDLVALPYHQDFENSPIVNWNFADGINYWNVGQLEDSTCLYITDGSGSNTYNTQSTSYSYAYIKFNVAKRTFAAVSFDWRCEGEGNYDNLRVFAVPSSINPVFSGDNGMESSSTTPPSGWIPVSEVLNGTYNWTNFSEVVELPSADDYYLVFFWKNDYSAGTDPSATVDNISIVPLSDENDIVAFDFVGAENVVIDNETHIITCDVPYTFNLDNVIPTIEISAAATITPEIGTAQNFNSNFTYTVTSESGLAQEWTVIVSRMAIISDAEILSFTAPGLLTVDIYSETATVEATISRMYDITSVMPAIEISNMATINHSYGTVYDFAEPVSFTVTAEDGTIKQWTVNMSYDDSPLGTDCTNPYIVDAGTDLPYIHTESTSGMYNMFNAYFEDRPASTVTMSGNDVVYRLDLPYRMMVNVAVSSAATNYGLFVMNSCGTHYADVIDSKTNINQTESVTLDLPAGSVYVFVDSRTENIDYELQITRIPFCYPVADIEVSRLQTELDVAWSTDNIGDSWIVKYGLSGFDVETAGTEVLTSNPYYSITGLTESTQYDIYVRADCNSMGTSEWAMVSASTISACQAPEDIAVVEVSDIEATLSWNGFNMTQWEVLYKQESETEYATLIVDEQSVTLTGLQYATNYNVRVRSVCDDGMYSDYTDFVFATMCTIVREFPFAENFDGDVFPPLCWTQERTAVGSGAGLNYVNGAWMHSSSSTGNNTTPKAMLADTKAGSAHNLVTTGLMFAESLNGYNVSLDVYRSSSSVASSAEGVEVWVSSSPNLESGNPQMLGYVSKNFQTEASGVAAEQSAGWYNYSFNIRDRVGVNYVILVGKSNNAGGVYADNLLVEKAVDCLPPSSLVLQSSDDDNVVLAWSDINAITGTWTISYSIDGGNEVEATVDEPTITITGLLPNTTYQISAQIQSVCAAGMESDLYESSIEVTTGCAILDVPYSENFDVNDGETPECWTSVSDDNNVWSVSNGMAHIASANVQNNAHLISPRFNMSGDRRYLMEFDVLQSTLNVLRPDSLFVLFIKNETEVDTLRSVAIQNADINGMAQIVVDVPQTNGAGRFDFALNGYRECSIDNFSLRAKSNEAEILTFAIEEQTEEPVIDSVNATISVYVANEPEYGMFFAPTFTISENATVNVESGDLRDFSGPVEYVVTAEDGVTTKTWTVTVSIDENACQNPTANDIDLLVVADSVTITIAQVNNETSYDLMVSSVQITSETDTADVFSGNVGSVTVINGLQYNTNYYVYVRSDCGATRWTEVTFATGCEVKQLPFSEDFSASTMPECWSIVDANNDNKTWALTSGEVVYTYSRLREADDYIVSPEISIVHNAKLKFDYHVGNFSYPETFSVYVIADADTIMLDSMVVRNEAAQTYGPVELTDFAGQDVRVAIRCQSAPYMYRLYVDNFDISVSNYVIESSVVGMGTITPAGIVEVAPGGSIEYTMVANENNEFVSLSLDGEDVTDEVVDGVYTLADITDEHNVVATFTERYVVEVSSSNGGHMEPEGEFIVNAGDSLRFIIVPDEGYRFVSLSIDGVAVALEQGSFMYSLDSITADHNVYATFTPIIYYTVTVEASENGVVTPNGSMSVEEGTSLTLYVLPDEGYMIGDFIVDGVDAVAELVDGQYTFENISSNHAVNVNFVENVYFTVTATSSEHGSITPEGESQVVNGGSVSFEVVPDEGYYVASFTVDGNDAMAGLVNGVYVLDNVTADHEVHVDFAIYTYNIFAYAHGGTISPSGSITVEYGQSQTFVMTPNNEYELSNVFIDNHVVEVEGNSYTFESVTANHNIVAVFTPMNITRYTISASAGEHGSISPSGNVRVVEGEDQTFEIVPDEHYYIASLLVDGNTVDVSDAYTFESVAANHTIAATFEINKHIVTATAGENGAVSPAGEIEVDEGGNVGLQFTPDEGYWVSEVIVDGDTIATHSNEYVVENVLDDIEVIVNFEPLPQWSITAMSSEFGSISPEGIQYVLHGSSIEFTFAPDDGYMIERVVVDGSTVATDGNSYTFENVTGDHYIYVSFRTLAYFITTVVGEHGRITPSGVVEVQPGESKMFRFVPDVGYQVDNVHVDGMNVMFSNNMYTFNNVNENHVIEVTFVHINVDIDDEVAMGVSLYPNPNNGQFSVDFAGINGTALYQLIDAGGAVVDVREVYVEDGNTMEFSYNLKPGVYFARFISGDKVIVEKFVVE